MKDSDWMDCDELQAALDRRHADLDKERDAHLATLKRVEWADKSAAYYPDQGLREVSYCPVCGTLKGFDHSDDCQIDAEIKRLEGEK